MVAQFVVLPLQQYFSTPRPSAEAGAEEQALEEAGAEAGAELAQELPLNLAEAGAKQTRNWRRSHPRSSQKRASALFASCSRR